MIRKLLCRLFGHDPATVFPCPGIYGQCRRCGLRSPLERYAGHGIGDTFGSNLLRQAIRGGTAFYA